ncbi:MAG: GNAT family N-acetyltransferase [Planctomycetota bacterium]
MSHSASAQPLNTDRLRLVPISLRLLHAEQAGVRELAAALTAEIPESWPPEHWEPHVLEYLVRQLAETPRAAEWPAFYFLLRGNDGNADRLIGCAGFATPPDDSGSVEMGYGLLPEFQGRGLAGEGCRAMVEYAFSHSEVERLLIHTLPDLAPSIRLAERLGFRFDGPGTEPGTVRYVLERSSRPTS